MAIKYAKRGITAPINVLWTNYFTNGNNDKAEQIWKEYLTEAPRIMFQKIVQSAREQQNEDLVKRLIEHLNKSKVTPGALGNAYSCLLDILVLKGKDEEVINTLENAVKTVTPEYFNRTAMLRVKEVYEKLQKPFPYPIPSKKTTAEINQEWLNIIHSFKITYYFVFVNFLAVSMNSGNFQNVQVNNIFIKQS